MSAEIENIPEATGNVFDQFSPSNDQSVDGIEALVALSERARDLESAKEDLESELSALKQELQQINERDLPEMMSELGLEDFTLSDGTKIKIKDFCRGSLPKGHNERLNAIAWIEANGGAEIMKTEVSLKFGKGEENIASSAVAILNDAGYDPVSEKNVHPQTLYSFAREKLKNGEELPVEDLGLYVGRTAKFTLGKGK